MPPWQSQGIPQAVPGGRVTDGLWNRLNSVYFDAYRRKYGSDYRPLPVLQERADHWKRAQGPAGKVKLHTAVNPFAAIQSRT